MTIKTWRERVGHVPTLGEELAAREAERVDLRAALATARKDERERLVQICLMERDKADSRKPDPPGSTMNVDHLLGQGWMANLLAKKFRSLTDE